jgi:hypothetical protein
VAFSHRRWLLVVDDDVPYDSRGSQWRGRGNGGPTGSGAGEAGGSRKVWDRGNRAPTDGPPAIVPATVKLIRIFQTISIIIQSRPKRIFLNLKNLK